MQHLHFEINWPRFAEFYITAAPNGRVFWAIGLFFARVTFYTKMG